MHGVYIHVPFCAKRCDYCAFATFTDRHHLTTDYLAALKVHIDRAVAAGMPRATSIFVGGGTPSMIPGHELAEVIASVPVVDGAEITVECNPDNVTVDLLTSYRCAGVNRLSLGVQSTVPHVLASLGRTHDVDSVRHAVEAIRTVGLPTFNLDIIYGASGESVEDWATTVRDVLALDPPHVSAYGLTVESGTPLADDPSRHPDDDDQADKYEIVDALFEERGLLNYEISNWSRPGHECQHNRLYWLQGNYHAFGSAAHGHMDGRRFWNVRTPERYIDLVMGGQEPESSSEVLDDDVRELEALQLLIRMREGVPLAAFSSSAVDGLTGLIERHDDRFVLTRAGRLMANEVSLRLHVDDLVN
jgi:putative oxygen-independent coproporphyrinogen III oxidase